MSALDGTSCLYLHEIVNQPNQFGHEFCEPLFKIFRFKAIADEVMQDELVASYGLVEAVGQKFYISKNLCPAA